MYIFIIKSRILTLGPEEKIFKLPLLLILNRSGAKKKDFKDMYKAVPLERFCHRVPKQSTYKIYPASDQKLKKCFETAIQGKLCQFIHRFYIYLLSKINKK